MANLPPAREPRFTCIAALSAWSEGSVSL